MRCLALLIRLPMAGSGQQERAGDLRRGQATDGAQRQRNRGTCRKHRMAAQEQQRQRIVHIGHCGRRGRFLRGGKRLAAAPGRVRTPHFGQPPGRDRGQPAARIRGHTVDRPPLGRRQQRLLHSILRIDEGVAEFAVPAHQRAEDLRRQLAQQALHIVGRRCRRCHRHSCGSGGLVIARTSIGLREGRPPGPGAADVRAAISMARCSLSTSTIQNPASESGRVAGGARRAAAGRPGRSERTYGVGIARFILDRSGDQHPKCGGVLGVTLAE